MQTVAFIDSGIGGIPYLHHALSHIPQMRGLYIADTACFPYGAKGPEFLKARLVELVQTVHTHCRPDVYVIACNTASVSVLDVLRQRFQQPIIGTVPAVKPAVRLSKNGKIGIMATEHTIRDPYLTKLQAEYAQKHEIIMLPATELIQEIEDHFFQPNENCLAEVVRRALRLEIDTAVLGCTHFIHVEAQLARLWGERIRMVDSRGGISRQIYRHLHDLLLESKPQLNQQELTRAQVFQRTSFLITSEERRSYYEDIAAHFSLDFSGLMVATPGPSWKFARL